MDAQGLAISVSINILSNLLTDLLKSVQGSRSSPIERAITSTVEKFPGIEGLKITLEQWLHSPGVLGALEEYAKGLNGFDPIKIDALSRTLVKSTQFFLPDNAEAVAREVVSQFFSEIRAQYLAIPELAIPHLANRLEEGISISRAGFESLKSEVEELRDSHDAIGSALDFQIDTARDRLQRNEYDVARQICEDLRQRSWDRMDARQKFRVLSNLATVNLRQENLNDAAKLFIEATGFQPDDPVALANEALAYSLLGDSERAFALAERVRERFPTSARALMVWLNAAPAAFTLENLEAAVPAHLGEDPEVIMALARRALVSRDTLKAEELSRRATVIKTEWSYPWALLGESIFRSALPGSAEDYIRAGSLCDASRLAAAAEACTKAIELAQKEKQPGIEAWALLIRAEARRLLGEADAEEDIVTAYSLHPDDATVLRDYAYMKLRRGRKRDAIEKLRLGVNREARADLRMMLAGALNSTGELNDRDEATEIFSNLATDSRIAAPEFRTHAAISTVDNLIKDQHWEQARAFLAQRSMESLSATALAALQGGVELAAGNREKASEAASGAVTRITATTSHDDIRLAAKLLADLGRHRDALPLWQVLATPGRLGYDSCRFIDCALRLGEHRLFLDFCEQLRQNGIYDPQLIEAEAGIRGHYDIDGTIGLLQEHLRRSPEDRIARLQLSVIGIQLGRDELVSSDPASMPRPEDTAPENWKTIVLVMRSGGHLWEALKFAYRLLRLNFGNVEAHRAYLASLLTTDPKPEIPIPDVAGPGTAVAFTEEGDTQIEWRVIEEETEPDVNLQEIGPGHFIAQQLAGKRVGDTFLLAQGSVVSKRATLLQVLSKYVYRFQECGENWLRRFPDHPDVQPVRIAAPRTAGADVDLSEFFQSFDRILAAHHEAIEAYRSHPIPIHVVAEALGRSEFGQTIRVETDESVPVRCCTGRAEERTAAMLALRNASGIVLDLTAISTLAILDALDCLQQFQMRFLVSEQALSEIRWLAEEHATEGSRTGLGRQGYRYVISEMTPGAVRAQRELLDSIVTKVKSQCMVVGCPELAAVPTDKREFLTKVAGEHGAQSIILASAVGNVLWTDDFAIAALAAHEFGVRRVWTQVALQERTEAGAIRPELLIEATAKLLGWRYYFTSTGVPALARAGAIAEWNPDRWPLKGGLEVFSDRGITTKDVVSLAISFILQYTGEVALPEVRDVVTVRILERLSSRGEGLMPVGMLLRALPAAFGLNVLRATELVRVASAWLTSKRGIQRDM